MLNLKKLITFSVIIKCSLKFAMRTSFNYIFYNQLNFSILLNICVKIVNIDAHSSVFLIFY